MRKPLTKKKAILFAAAALVLLAAIIFGCVRYAQHKTYACQYAKPFSYAAAVEGDGAPVLIAHRGAAVYAPENTLPAYEKAAALGFHYAETDIRATADGEWVLSHDASLKRMTGYKGIIEQMTLSEVLTHKIIKGAGAKQYPDLYTPTLEQFLALCRRTALTPVIEIKTEAAAYPNAPYKRIVELLEQYGLLQDAVVISFDEQALQRIREYSAAVQEQLLVNRLDESSFEITDKLAPCGIDCAYKELLKKKDLMQLAQTNGIVLNAWTVDTQAAAAELAACGVDYITTNAAMP